MLKRPIVVGILLTITHCTEPCLELSTRICKCEATQAQQQNCVQTKKGEASNRETNAREQEVCEGLLDKKECQEMTICDADHYLECGVAVPNEEGAN